MTDELEAEHTFYIGLDRNERRFTRETLGGGAGGYTRERKQEGKKHSVLDQSETREEVVCRMKIDTRGRL